GQAFGVNFDDVWQGGGCTYITRIFGLVQDAARRSSLILLNPDGVETHEPVDLVVEIWDERTGQRASQRSIQLPARSSIAIPSVLAAEAPDVARGWAVVTSTSGDLA